MIAIWNNHLFQRQLNPLFLTASLSSSIIPVTCCKSQLCSPQKDNHTNVGDHQSRLNTNGMTTVSSIWMVFFRAPSSLLASIILMLVRSSEVCFHNHDESHSPRLNAAMSLTSFHTSEGMVQVSSVNMLKGRYVCKVSLWSLGRASGVLRRWMKKSSRPVFWIRHVGDGPDPICPRWSSTRLLFRRSYCVPSHSTRRAA